MSLSYRLRLTKILFSSDTGTIGVFIIGNSVSTTELVLEVATRVVKMSHLISSGRIISVLLKTTVTEKIKKAGFVTVSGIPISGVKSLPRF